MPMMLKDLPAAEREAIMAELLRPFDRPELNDPSYWDPTEHKFAWTDEKRAEAAERWERSLAGDEDAWVDWEHPERIAP